MDILDILKIISIIVSLLLVFWAWQKLANQKSRILFSAMVVLFCLSTVLFFPEGEINDWLKHVPFYFGQFFFLLFLNHEIRLQENGANSHNQPQALLAGIIPVWPLATSHDSSLPAASQGWFHFITEQGLQHILAVPFLFLIVAVVKIKAKFVQSADFLTGINIMLAAGVFLAMIHLGEFVVESQAWLQFLAGDLIEILEFIWYYLAVFIFMIALAKLAKAQPRQKTNGLINDIPAV